jgi:hypothetical protein
MTWIQLEEGEYVVEAALLVSAEGQALAVDDASLVVFRDREGHKRMRGFGATKPALMVTLLEGGDRLDLLLDFGGAHKYRMENPRIQSGKVFSPQAHSTIHFSPTQPWQRIDRDRYRDLTGDLQMVSG